MSKAIEEAANEYADNASYPAPDYGWYESDDEQMKDVLADTFKAGAKHVYDLPLAQRLTDTEKEQFRKMYKRMVVDVEHSDSYDCIPASEMDCAMETLERSFGKDFFKEDKL